MSVHPLRLRVAVMAALGAVSILTAGSGALAAPDGGDPALGHVEALDSALLEAMKGGHALGAKGRYRKLTPVVQSAFDLPLMTRFAVGPAWTRMSDAEHQALIQAFTRLSIANYAHNFDAYGGERFVIEPNVQTRGLDKIVQTRLIVPKGAPTTLTYRMRQTAGGWKIVDVYYGAVSQLTTRRADFAGPLAAGGAKGLLTHLDSLTAKLLE